MVPRRRGRAEIFISELPASKTEVGTQALLGPAGFAASGDAEIFISNSLTYNRARREGPMDFAADGNAEIPFLSLSARTLVRILAGMIPSLLVLVVTIPFLILGVTGPLFTVLPPHTL